MRDILLCLLGALRLSLVTLVLLWAGLPADPDGARAMAVAVAGEWQSQDRCARRRHRFTTDWTTMGRARMVPRSSFGDHRGRPAER